MITAEEFIRQNLYVSKGEYNVSLEPDDVHEELGRLAEQINIFAKEAIKADRINLLKHVEWNSISEDTCFGANKDKYDFLDTDGGGDPCTGYIISINENSILNAPNIELL